MAIDCIFCRIAAGEADSSRVYEDDEIVAFLTLRPTRPGELLVIPRGHIDHFTDVPEPLAGHMMKWAHRLGRVLRQELEPRRVGLVVSGFGVPHAHVVVLPLEEEQDITSARFAWVDSDLVRFDASRIDRWPRHELDRMAARLGAALEREASGGL
jgi:histidine triad (HIT) family protein